MKKLYILFLFLFPVIISNAQTNVSGGIYVNTTWTLAGSPYIVVDTLVVFPGVTLTIDPGVVVKFDNQKYLEIRQANLIANGTVTDSITFTSNSGTPTPGIWGNISYGGIYLNGVGTATSFNYVIVKYATKGIYGASNIAGIRNSHFLNNQIGLNYASPLIDSCTFEFNGTGAENISFCSVNYSRFSSNNNGVEFGHTMQFTNCIFDYNQAALGWPSFTSLENCTISNNRIGILTWYFNNTISNSLILSNDSVGLSFTGGPNSIINCVVKYNKAGVQASSDIDDPFLITQCIIDSNLTGVDYYGAALDMYCNRICSNTLYDFHLGSSNNLTIGSNYWCTSDSLSTTAVIYDGYDNPNFGLVTFMPVDTSFCYLPLEKEEIESDQIFNIFPNPASDYLKIHFIGNSNSFEVIIVNLLGEMMYSSILSKQEAALDISAYPIGIYFLEVMEGNTVSRERFVKQ
jgi:hypothetical protein